MDGFDGLAVGAVAAGGILVYTGLSGRSALSTIQSLVQGNNPNTSAPVHPVADTGAAAEAAAAVGNALGAGIGTAVTSGGTGQQIATDAQKYNGEGYVWGGAPARGLGNWDCSSFVNWVVGHDLGMAIPTYKAGSYSGRDHGPTAAMWLVWTGASTLGTDPALAQPGDLCCWQTHIGICIGGGRMISARSAKDNPPTGINTIGKHNIPGEILFVRRIKASAVPGGSVGSALGSLV